MRNAGRARELLVRGISGALRTDCGRILLLPALPQAGARGWRSLFFGRSEHVAREILALRELFQLGIDESGVDSDAFLAVPARIERDLLEQPLHHGMQAPRANVLGLLVDRPRDLGATPDPVGMKA